LTGDLRIVRCYTGHSGITIKPAYRKNHVQEMGEK